MQILGLGKVYIFIQKGDGKWHLPEIKEALSAEPTRMSFGLMNKIRPEFNSGEKKKEKTAWRKCDAKRNRRDKIPKNKHTQLYLTSSPRNV